MLLDGRSQIGWSQHATFKLILVNHLPDGENFEQEAVHQFTDQKNDWGFCNFASLQMAQDPSKGFSVDGAVTFGARITLQDDQYDSRKNTGFAGFKNQVGNSLYVHSFLWEDVQKRVPLTASLHCCPKKQLL